MAESVPEHLDAIAKEIVHACFLAHKTLGPGLIESVYETCLTHELRKLRRVVDRQVQLPILYDGLRIDGGLSIDMLVDGEVIVELKAVESMLPVFEAQLLTYLKLANKRLGLLVNFNVPKIKDGIRRFAL